MPSIEQLLFYPIKSCKGCSAPQSNVSSYGLEHDRRFMVIDAKNGVFFSQRTFPRLALVTAIAEGQHLKIRGPIDMSIAASIKLPFRDGPIREVSVHKMPFSAHDQGDIVADWFSVYLDHECRVVAVSDQQMRRRQHGELPFIISNHDSSPIHLITNSSLSSLNQELVRVNEKSVNFDRFRPNIVLKGVKNEFEEETWRAVRVGDILLQVRKPTGRCSITCVDQESGEISKEPLKTLARMRKTSGPVNFGVYLMPVTTGVIRVGDEVEILK